MFFIKFYISYLKIAYNSYYSRKNNLNSLLIEIYLIISNIIYYIYIYYIFIQKCKYFNIIETIIFVCIGDP